MLDHDDYRLTAYVLGELEPEDRAEVEAALADSPELRHVVEEIRRADALLGEAFHGEPTAELHESQRDAIHAAAAQAIGEAVAEHAAEAALVDTAIEKLPNVSVAVEPAQEVATKRRSRTWLYVNAAVLLVAATLLVSWGYYESTRGEALYQSTAWLRTEEIYIVFGGAHKPGEGPLVDPSVTDEEILSERGIRYAGTTPLGSTGGVEPVEREEMTPESYSGVSGGNSRVHHSLLNDVYGRDQSFESASEAPDGTAQSPSENVNPKPGHWKGRAPGQEFVGANMANELPGVYVTAEQAQAEAHAGGGLEDEDKPADSADGSGTYVETLVAPTNPPEGEAQTPLGYVVGSGYADDQVSADETTLVVPLAQLHSRITAKEVEQELLKAQSKAYEEKLATADIDVNEEAVEAEAQRDANVKQIQEEVRTQREVMNRVLAASGKGNRDPRFQAMSQQVLELERKRNELLDERREEIRDQRVEQEKQRREESLGKAQSRIAQNQLEIDLLRGKYFSQRSEINKKSSVLLDLSFKQSELQREQQVVDMISGRIMRLRTEMTAPAKVTLLRKAEPTTEKVRLKPQPATTANQPMTGFMRTQLALIRSPLVLEQVLARPDIAQYPIIAEQKEPIKWLQEHLSVNAAKNSELFLVSFGSPDPELSATVANAITEVYFRMHTQDEAQRSTRVVELLEDERARRMAKIKQMRDQLKEIKKRTIGTTPAQKKPVKKPAVKKTTSWRRVKAVPNASRLMVGDEDELALEGMQANVRIDGFRARVIVDYYFYNDRDTRLEGTFKLRLPDDASLYYFAFGESSLEYRPQAEQLVSAGFIPPEALRTGGMQPADIFRVRSGTWNNVKEARIVPREKAAHAYSETVRRRIDPALVEWAGAGVFNARVYPLAARKLHRIVVGYDVNLTQESDALTYQFQLPEEVSQTVVDVDLAALPGTTAEVTPTTRAFTSGGRAYYHIDSPSDRFVGVRLEGVANLLLTGSDEAQNEFFATRVTPELKSQERSNGSTRAVFLVDTSLSSQPDRFNVFLKLMEATLNENRSSLKEFSTLFFGIDTHWWHSGYTANTPENVLALLKYCETLSLEGATDLNAALAEAASPHWAKANAKQTAKPDFFLFSDGAATWGETNLSQSIVTKLAAQGSVFAYKTGYTGTATGTLEALVRSTGGSLISVADEAEIGAAATAHRSRPWQFQTISLAGCRDLLIAGRPEMIYAGQPLMIVGRGKPEAGAELVLELKRGSETKSVKMPLADHVPSELAARCYGQVAVGQLEELLHTTEEVSVAYARHFRVTGQTCSLLMLDSEADYQRFNIKPENDVQVVLSRPAAELIASKLKDLGQTLHDSKAALLAWLTKLESTPGVQFKTPAELASLLAGLPAHSFEMPASRLVCQRHTSADWARGYAEQLKAASLSAEAVRFEADRRFATLGGPDALKALSNLIEQSPGDVVLTRDVAYSALQWELPAQAYPLLKRVADARPFEPQTYLALAECAADAQRTELAMLYYEIALAGTWNQRYGEFRQIAALEYQQLLTRIIAGEVATKADRYATSRLAAIQRETSLKRADLIITAQWNTDRTDVDLHVEEPSGEVCFYSHNQTRSGGKLSRDVTEGFGPEMYTTLQALPGVYRVQMHYYRSDANRTQAATKVYLTVYRNFGGQGSRIERHTIVLKDKNDKQEVLTIKVPERALGQD